MESKIENVDGGPYSLLKRHCRMYLYGSNGSPEVIVNEVAQDFYIFALLHLISTMFITADNKNDENGGIFHRILDPLGKEILLIDIDKILSQPIGKTTLKQYIRTKRNKLATHGKLSFSSQPEQIKKLTFNEKNVNQFYEGMRRLDKAVYKLYNDLEKLEEQ